VVQDIDSLPDAALAEPPAAGLLRWAAQRWHPPRFPGPGIVFPDAAELRAWTGWIDLAWVVLWLLGLAGILIFERWEAIPFHLIWITFALLYSFRVRTTGATVWVLAAMVVTTFAAISMDVLRGAQPADELTEVPLMAAMFWVMMWHGRRRQAADAESVRVIEENGRLLTMQQQFLQDASHQLRTPITIALGHSELLAKNLVDNQDKRDINVVVGELNRLRLLSERLLLIAASADPDFLQPESVELGGFVADVLWRWRRTADRRWQLGRVDEAIVAADRERLGLAVDALLENAVQHTRPGDTIRLSVISGEGQDRARLVVEDTGSGIAPVELAHIFERFATGSQTAGRRGTGLGLALVRAVADGHGGGIEAYSALGQGSRFELTLPLLTAPTTTTMPHTDPCRSSR
jgi:signal transduction histidine kinase